MRTDYFALILIGVMVISSVSLLAVKSANAQTANPSVPEFRAKYVLANDSNPESIDIIVKNQPFVSSDDLTSFNYNVRYKEHSQENWTEVFTGSNAENRLYGVQNVSFENTSISLYQTEDQVELKYGFAAIDIQGYNQVDFQVEAVIATFHPFAPHSDIGTWTYVTSGWSPTQTVTITAGSASPTQSSSSSPAVPEFPLIAILPLFVAMFFVAVKVRHRKTIKLTQ